MYKLYLFVALLIVAGCQNNLTEPVAMILKERLKALDYTVIESLYGDYNGDGVEDVAAIVKFDSTNFITSSIEAKTIWFIDSLSVDAEQALVIALNSDLANGTTYFLLSEYDRFISPSFKLLKATQNEITTSLEGLVADGEVLIIPSEAGIDEFVFLVDGQVKFISPEDIP